MPLIIKILIPGLIIVIIAAGGAISWKLLSKSTIEDSTSMPIASLQANNTDDSITVPFETPITLSWEIKNVKNCLISGDWLYNPEYSSFQSVGKITKPTNYILDCFDSEGRKISDSVAIDIDDKTIPLEFLSSISLTDLFKDFRYFWKKELCLGLKNDPDVVALQTALFFEGILSPQEKITGNYDDDTFQAVKKFQENYGIAPQTGCVGPKTITLLNNIFYYYNYSDQLAFQESSQKQITATTKKISSYQQQEASAPTTTPAKPPITTLTTTTPTTPTTPKPYVDLKVNNSNRNVASVQKGETVILTWTSKNTKSCTASGNWTGSKPTSNTSGETTEPINKYATFKLTCAGENNQNAADSVYISIPYIPPLSENKKGPVINEVIAKEDASSLGWNMEIEIRGSGFSPGSIMHLGTAEFQPEEGSTETSLKFKTSYLERVWGQEIDERCFFSGEVYYSITVENNGLFSNDTYICF